MSKWQDILRRNQEKLNKYNNPDGTFNEELWKKDKDKDNIGRLYNQLRLTDPEIKESDAKKIYEELIKPTILYHEPEDGDFIEDVISCYQYFKNYFNNRKE